jgi:hypothetical protein
MLKLVRAAKYDAAKPRENRVASKAQVLKDRLVACVRVKCTRLSKHIDRKLTPSTDCDHRFTDGALAALKTGGYMIQPLLDAINSGTVLDFLADDHNKTDLARHLAGTGAYYLDYPGIELTIRKQIFHKRHLPFGLAVVAAIITEVTCAPCDLTWHAYDLWQLCFINTFKRTQFGAFSDMKELQHTKYDRADLVVFAFTTTLIQDVLIPALRKYKALENHRVLTLVYRHWLLKRIIRRIFSQFLDRLEAHMTAEISGFGF